MSQVVLPQHKSGRPESGSPGRNGGMAIVVLVVFGMAVTALWWWMALRTTSAQSELLYSDVAGIGQQRDLECQVQECRRRFLSMLPSAGTEAMRQHLAGLREAERQIGLLTGSMRLERLESGERSRVWQFASDWAEYRSVEDDMIALVLAHRGAEAKLWEEAAGRQFEKAMTSLHAIQTTLDEDALRRQMTVQTISGR